MKVILTLFFVITSLFSDLISLDKNGGNGIFSKSAVLSSSPTIFSAGGTSGISIFSIVDNKLETRSTVLSSINVKDIEIDPTENYLYAACDNNGLYVLDITTPTSPTTVQGITATGQTIDIFIDKTNKLLAVGNDSNGAYIYDITTPNSPSLKTKLLLNTGVKKVSILENFFAVAFVDGTVEVYDVTNVNAPEKKYTFSNFSSVEDLGFFNGHFVVVDKNSGLFLYNISHIDLPILKGIFPIQYGKSFTVKSDEIYLTTTDKIIYTLDGDDVTKLQYKGSITLDFYANDLVFYNDYLIASKLDRSLELLKESQTSCVAGVIYGKNPITKNWGKFFNSCDIPSGWATQQETPTVIQTQDLKPYTKEDIDKLSSGWHLLGTSAQISDLSIFAGAKSVWKYSEGKWYAFSPNVTLNDRIRVSSSYDPLVSIEAGKGFWVEIQ
ncbi:MAG: hypothetical protein OIF32_05040 [Campylobacterales bacterium]|nr:hypothetical protein [Campylobacterales bacterium]